MPVTEIFLKNVLFDTGICFFLNHRTNEHEKDKMIFNLFHIRFIFVWLHIPAA